MCIVSERSSLMISSERLNRPSHLNNWIYQALVRHTQLYNVVDKGSYTLSTLVLHALKPPPQIAIER